MHPIFITGGTGYIGKRLIKKLVALGYDVTALVRKGSENKLPKGVRAIIADPFDASTFLEWIPKNSIYIQLLGVSHPSPSKKNFFHEIDLKSAKTSADAAAKSNAIHFVYVSVVMAETKMMKEYQDVRKECEAYILSKNIPCTFIRPWYVLGPGHWWPMVLLPFYSIAKFVPAWQKKGEQFGVVTINQMLKALVHIIEAPPPQKQRILEVKHIKKNILPAI